MGKKAEGVSRGSARSYFLDVIESFVTVGSIRSLMTATLFGVLGEYVERWSAVGAAAMAAGGAMVLLLLTLPPHADHRTPIPEHAGLAPVPVLAAKGHPADDIADIGIRVFQVARSGDRVEEKNEVTPDDILTFTYTFAKPHDGYLALFGVQKSGAVRWYYPDYGEEKSIEIKGDRVDEPLGDGIDLSVNHVPGWLCIVAVFSEHPIDVETVENGIEQVQSSSSVAELPSLVLREKLGANSLQYSVTMEIEEEP